MRKLSADDYQYWAVDFVRGELTIIMANGQRISESVPAHSGRIPHVARAVFDWERWWVFSTTTRGDSLVSEAYSPIHTDKGRPAVYLDQNHWSTLAWATVDSDRVVDKDELAAALRIIELANDAGIVLPLSSAHFAETGPLRGDRRYNLGLSMARLSGGWEMRSPRTVWLHELMAMLAARSGIAVPERARLPVITTEPQAFLADGVHAYELTSEMELFKLVLAEPSVTLSLLIDPDPRPKGDVSYWIERNQWITDYFARESLSDRARREQAAGFFWADNIQVLVEAANSLGVDPRAFASSAGELITSIETMPFVANFAALHRLRFLDRKTRWKRNDLIDMMYLSCAAAYCDYVVAEKHTGTQLQAIAKARAEPSNVFVKLADLADALERDGVQTASERARYVQR